MWDTASYLAGLASAFELGIIDKNDFDRRMSSILKTLNHANFFRDELPNLFPGRSVPMLTLSEFIHQAGDAFKLPQLKRKAIVQGHCHHKAVMKFEPEEAVLQKAGIEYEHLDSGCCGMAGAFGFEKKNYEISMRIGDRVLLPRVRDAANDTLIIADGFSCREQIVQATGREAMHLAEVLQMAYMSSRA